MMFARLFEPGKVGKLEVKNRIVMPPMVTRFVADDGTITERMVHYYVERARGGAGLIVIEASYPRFGGYPGRIYIDDDRCIPGLERLARCIREAGAKVILQINPGRGRQDEVDVATASEVFSPTRGVMARALSAQEAEKLIAECGEGVARAKKAGFDGVQIHAAHGYLVSEFLSPLINKRTDKYGGDIAGRARFAVELVQVAKAKAGDDYPVIFRFSVHEHLGGGFSIKEAMPVAQLVERAGADAIDVVSGVAETQEYVIAPMSIPRGHNVAFAEQLKKAVNIPVMVAGRINDPYLAEEILEQEKADFIDMGRALIADPEFPRKTKEGRVADIRKCVACLRCLENIMVERSPLACTVNAFVGREKEYEIRPAKKAKNVLVVGGGPGGMEAARIAALRGHKVTLWEKENRLGGQINLAVVPPYKEELNNLSQYLVTQIEKLGVKADLSKEATLESIMQLGPDAVIVATGARSIVPQIPGVDQNKVVSSYDVLAGRVSIGERIAVIGGGFIACEVAEFLADRGKAVTIVYRRGEIARELMSHIRTHFVNRLRNKGIRVLLNTKYEELDEKMRSETDNFVASIGSVPNKELFQELQNRFPEVYAIGDCVEARRILEAVHEGAAIGYQI